MAEEVKTETAEKKTVKKAKAVSDEAVKAPETASAPAASEAEAVKAPKKAKAAKPAAEAKAEVKTETPAEVKPEEKPVKKAAALKTEEKKAEEKLIKVTLIKSCSGICKRQKDTVAALGLKKVRQFNIIKDNAAARGMIFLVKHLVSVEEVK